MFSERSYGFRAISYSDIPGIIKTGALSGLPALILQVSLPGSLQYFMWIRNPAAKEKMCRCYHKKAPKIQLFPNFSYYVIEPLIFRLFTLRNLYCKITQCDFLQRVSLSIAGSLA